MKGYAGRSGAGVEMLAMQRSGQPLAPTWRSRVGPVVLRGTPHQVGHVVPRWQSGFAQFGPADGQRRLDLFPLQQRQLVPRDIDERLEESGNRCAVRVHGKTPAWID